jgi:hypothetical protein
LDLSRRRPGRIKIARAAAPGLTGVGGPRAPDLTAPNLYTLTPCRLSRHHQRPRLVHPCRVRMKPRTRRNRRRNGRSTVHAVYRSTYSETAVTRPPPIRQGSLGGLANRPQSSCPILCWIVTTPLSQGEQAPDDGRPRRTAPFALSDSSVRQLHHSAPHAAKPRA